MISLPPQTINSNMYDEKTGLIKNDLLEDRHIGLTSYNIKGIIMLVEKNLDGGKIFWRKKNKKDFARLLNKKMVKIQTDLYRFDIYLQYKSVGLKLNNKEKDDIKSIKKNITDHIENLELEKEITNYASVIKKINNDIEKYVTNYLMRL